MPVLSQNMENRFHMALKYQFCPAILRIEPRSCSLELHVVPRSVDNNNNNNNTHIPLSSMMTPEAAALLLLSITQQQQPPRLNLSFPLIDVKLPAATNLYCSRDRARINSILQSGMMPTINWKTVKKELTFELGRFLHRKIKAHFEFVDSSSTATRQQQVVVDIDNLLEKEQADIYVLHDKCMVYVVTFSSDVCSKIYLVAAETTDISVQLNEEIIGGIKAVGNSEQMQKSEEAVYTANYGATIRPQRSTLK